MDQTKLSPSRLFVSTVIDSKKDDFDEKYERGYQHLQTLTQGLSEKEAHDALNSAVCKDKLHEELVTMGLITVILTEPHNAPSSYRDLTLVTRDGHTLALASLSQLVLERWPRLSGTAHVQMLWLLRQLVRNWVQGTDTLAWNLMRLAAGGDVSPANLSLVEGLLDLYNDNRPWLEKHPLLLASVVYTFLRLTEDHHPGTSSAPGLTALRHKEVAFTVGLLRDKFADCLLIGRDLVRLLQNVARIPEYERLWHDMLHNPKSLAPNFTGILQLLQSRTSRRFLQSRLTPDMERKLVFLTSSVRFGNHKRYQDWFQRQYLALPESQTLRCDLIRFIVGVIHPTNELLCSDIIPRWAVIGWLLTSCTSAVAVANAKLALFYDWLFFEPDKDNIMNIEPAILVMHHSMRSHPVVTTTLLDFLCRIIAAFYPPLCEKVKQGICCSLRQILEKRVLPSLSPLFEYPKLDRELRTLIRETFLEFCFAPSIEGGRIDDMKDDYEATEEGGLINHQSLNNHHPHLNQSEPSFSDEESEPSPVLKRVDDDDDDDDIPLGERLLSSSGVGRGRLKRGTPPPDIRRLMNATRSPPPGLGLGLLGAEEELKGLEGKLRLAVLKLHSETDNEAKCEAMERITQYVIQDEEESDSETLAVLAKCLCRVLHHHIQAKIFPHTLTDDSLDDSIGQPLFVLMRCVSELSDEDSRRLPLISLLVEMCSHEQRIGYLLLYYLHASKSDRHTIIQQSNKLTSKTKSQVYKDYCMALDKDFSKNLLSDLQACQDDDLQMFCWLIPGIYTTFADVALGNAQLMHLIVSSIDSNQLQDLVFKIIQGRLVMFGSGVQTFVSLVQTSLTWETVEQVWLWQLINASSPSPIGASHLLPLLTTLQHNTHSEAVTALLLMLKQHRPTAEMVKQLMTRDTRVPGDDLAESALLSWCRDGSEEKCAELVATLLSQRCQASPTKRKRGGGGGGVGQPTCERILAHLDRLRLRLSYPRHKFYKLDALQKALQAAQSACSDVQRSAFSNLFALIEVSGSAGGGGGGGGGGTGGGRGGAGRKAKAGGGGRSGRGQTLRSVSDTSESSSEEEEIVKPKQAKKRKKVVNAVGSDSD
ncbi:integrator complex subunit 3 [Nilaparvata lugens]|uniref:integrator complex subunit 3 n=1 Tax=Nilaparvata lugens TaxID=108931 RepID=UPI00193D666F|nr:integrator complex subunit 3 [Nilaparvata lugens]